MEALTPDVVFGVAFVIGVLFRTVLPYIKKKAVDPRLKFDAKFVWTAVLALVLGFIEVMTILAVDPLTGLRLRTIAFLGFFNGLGMNEIVNRILHR